MPLSETRKMPGAIAGGLLISSPEKKRTAGATFSLSLSKYIRWKKKRERKKERSGGVHGRKEKKKTYVNYCVLRIKS